MPHKRPKNFTAVLVHAERKFRVPLHRPDEFLAGQAPVIELDPAEAAETLPDSKAEPLPENEAAPAETETAENAAAEAEAPAEKE